MKLLIIDNYDSFTFNLVQIIEDLGVCKYLIVKNDKVLIHDVAEYDKILFSPGPGTPFESSIMNTILKEYHKIKSILGICLGHQAIAEFYGAKLFNLQEVNHGIRQKIKIIDKEDYIFANILPEIYAGLYHSWAVLQSDLPSCLKITAISQNKIIMAISHSEFDVRGIQFHPESIMTDVGKEIIYNWLTN